MRIVCRSQIPFSFTRYRIDGNVTQVNFLLRRQLLLAKRCGSLKPRSTQLPRAHASRDHIHALDQCFQIRRVMIRVVDAEYRAVADNDFAAWIDEAAAAACSAGYLPSGRGPAQTIPTVSR